MDPGGARAKLLLRPTIERKFGHLMHHAPEGPRPTPAQGVLQARLPATMVNLQRLFVLGAFERDMPSWAA